MRFEVFDMVNGHYVGRVRANGLRQARGIARALYGDGVNVREVR